MVVSVGTGGALDHDDKGDADDDDADADVDVDADDDKISDSGNPSRRQ